MNLHPVQFHSGARRELRKATERYDEQLPGLGDELVSAVEDSIRLIAANPGIRSPHAFGTRRAQLRRFPYSLIYTQRVRQVIIVAVAHHRHRPDYWLRRL